MNNDAILASISKIHTYRYAKEKQKGALTTNGGFSTTDPALLQVPCTIQCIFKITQTNNNVEPIFLMSSDLNGLRLTYQGGNLVIFISGNSKIIEVIIGKTYNIVFSLGSDQTIVYIDGISVFTSNTPTDNLSIYYIGSSSLNTYFRGDYLLHRHFNYAMSADEVKTLDNNGNPLGYVVSSNYKILGDTYLSDFSEGADGWYVTPLTDYVTITVSDGAVVVSKDSANQNMIIGRLHSPYNVQISNYSVQLKFSEPLPSQVISISVRPFNSIYGVTLNISPDRLTASGIFINSTSKPNGGSLIIFRATGSVSISVSSVSFTPSICLAEYVAPNLIATKKHDSIIEVSSNNSYTWTGTDDTTYMKYISLSENLKKGIAYRVSVTVSDYESGNPFIHVNIVHSIPAANGTYDIYVFPTGENTVLYIAGGNENTDRKLTLTINSVTPVSAASTWLDSAKQLPWSDAYLPPLLQSKGGYDMVANGAPEVLFNE